MKKDFQRLAQVADQRKAGYSYFIDLHETEFNLPVRLYCGGFWNGMNKLELAGVSKLGLRRVEKIVKIICGDSDRVKIFRIDWAVDVLGISAWQLARCCSVNGVVNSAFFRSRGGVSFYPHMSKSRSILIYERGKRLKANHDPLAKVFKDEDLTRLEVQFKGKGVPIRQFSRIREYKNVDILEGVSFWRIMPIARILKPLQVLQAEGLYSLIRRVGLQNASKTFAAPAWAYLRKKYLAPAGGNFPDLQAMMKREVEDWLESRLRFPRFE